MSYDKALTVFAPDGNLFQVQYALEAVERGTSTIGVRGKDCVILGVEKKAELKLQDPRSIKKILPIDRHITMTFAGLQADAKVLANKARLESQSYRYNMEDTPSIDYLAKFIAKIQQQYTQRSSVRPFGCSVFLIGFDEETKDSQLYMTDPAGSCSRWKAHAIGRNSKNLKSYLEKHYEDDLTEDQTIRLAIETLLESVESEKHIEICIQRFGQEPQNMKSEDIERIVKQIREQREAS